MDGDEITQGLLDSLKSIPKETVSLNLAGTLSLEVLGRRIDKFSKTMPFTQASAGTSVIWDDWIGEKISSDLTDFFRLTPADKMLMLSNPTEHNLTFGFEPFSPNLAKPEMYENIIQRSMQCLAGLMQMLGLARIPSANKSFDYHALTDIQGCLASIEREESTNFSFPNPFNKEFGIDTGKGVASIRAWHALYFSCVVRRILGDCSGKNILEIGGGSGRTGYFLQNLGARITVLDLPYVSMQQAYFFGSSMSQEQLMLYGEASDKAATTVELLPVSESALRRIEDTEFDLVVQFDGITEYDQAVAKRYMELASRVSPAFLSINHEANSFTFNDLCRQIGVTPKTRLPSLYRKNYVEEYVVF